MLSVLAVQGLLLLLARFRAGFYPVTPPRRSGDPGPAATALLQTFGDQEGQLERLAGVEPRVAVGVVAVGQRCSVIAWAPPVHSVTFWPVISRWTPPAWVPSAWWTAKKALHLRQDAVEGPGLVAVSRT